MSVNFPRAWQITESEPAENHHESCSWRAGKMLCDCDVILQHPELLDDHNYYGVDGILIESYLK